MGYMSEKYVLGILRDIDAVITDSHIVYTSGKHGSAYVNKDAIYPHTKITSDLCFSMAHRFMWCKPSRFCDIVVAPAVGGVILSQWIAYHLSNLCKYEVLSAYAESVDAAFELKRGYDKLVTGKRVLVVEDVLNTGGSVSKVVDAVRKAGGKVVGVAAICNRGGVTKTDLGLEDADVFITLVDMRMDAWDEAECPMCGTGVPINTDVGKGRAYLARKQARA